MSTPLILEREKTHGDYSHTSMIIQDIKAVMRRGRNWGRLSTVQRETLEMNAHKIGRILSGNPDEPDHWKDIAGYATLVVDRLPGPAQARPETVKAHDDYKTLPHTSPKGPLAPVTVSFPSDPTVTSQNAPHAYGTCSADATVLKYNGPDLTPPLDVVIDGCVVEPSWHTIQVVADDGITYYLVDRDYYSDAGVAHLKELSIFIPSSEYHELANYYRPLYFYDGSSYALLDRYREHWSFRDV